MPDRELLSVSVLGDGSWGTTFAIHLAELGHKVFLWSAFPDQAAEMVKFRENKKFHPGYAFPDNVQATADINIAVTVADFVVCAVPSQFIRQSLSRITVKIPPTLGVISLAKGIENGTLMRTTDIISDVKPFKMVGGLWGPSHAEEVARKLPTVLVAACANLDFAKKVQRAVNSDFLRVYVNDDVVGAEIGGAVKNVIAIAAGILEGLQLGDNARSALITRGLAEMARLGAALGAKPITFMGLTGVGDLITTCVSPYGRNRHVGLEIGKGRKLKDIVSEMTMIAEGVDTCKSVKELAKKQKIEMPICDAVYDVLFKDANPKKAVLELMRRGLKHELQGL